MFFSFLFFFILSHLGVLKNLIFFFNFTSFIYNFSRECNSTFTCVVTFGIGTDNQPVQISLIFIKFCFNIDVVFTFLNSNFFFFSKYSFDLSVKDFSFSFFKNKIILHLKKILNTMFM